MVRLTEIGTKEAENGYLLCRCVVDLIVITLRYLILEWGIISIANYIVPLKSVNFLYFPICIYGEFGTRFL